VLPGADRLDSIDASRHDNPTLLMDLNEPVPHDMCGRYSCVIDFGTLEHVFDAAQSFKNLIDLTSLGGHVLIATTCTNWGGHGFYEFSPEFFFRLLGRNGFDNIRIFLAESERDSPWYEATDPDKLGRRVQFTSDQNILLLAVARRAGAVPFTVPIQSDYAALWEGRPLAPAPARRTMIDFVRYRIGKNLMKLASVLHRIGRRCGGAPLSSWEDEAAFKRIRAEDVRL
jgi:SAM-dependent methyltransferase